MKISRHWFELLVAALVSLPVTALSQGTQVPPPPCCNEDRLGLVRLLAPEVQSATAQDEAVAEAGITISESMMRTLGLSRVEILDLLCNTFLPGKDTEILFYRSQYIDPGAINRLAGTVPADAGRSTAPSVSSAEVRLLYRIPRPALRQGDLDMLDHLYLSDGRTVVEVTFRASQNSNAIR